VSAWREIALEELTENFDGKRVPVKEAQRKAGQYPYYGASGVVDHVDKYIFDGEYLLIAEDGENLRTQKTPIAFLARGKFWVNNHAHIVTGNAQADTRFLMYALNNADINGFLTGSTMPKLTQGNMNRIPILAPPLPEQRAIASVLGSLDDKIELNRRMNETLEALAQSLFKSWFVDFDAVRASGGKFQESAIGPVPKGWKVERFDKHITADRGLSYKGEGLRDDGTGLPMHNLNSVYEGGGYKHEGIKYYAGEYREKHRLQPGDMIVTNTEQGFDHLLIGHAAIVPKRYGPQGLFSHHIYRVRHKPTSPFSPHYLVELFNNRRWHYWISGFSNGTTINMLPKDALEMPLLVVPPDELVKKFTALAEAVHTKVEANLEESRTLAALRDALLPKLLSGELRVPAAAGKLAEACP
jgi:type I restriction enzyme S subunit